MTPNTYSPLHTILTTAKREIQILFSKKSVIITLVIMLVAILAAVGFASWQKNKDPEEKATPVAVVNVDKQALEGSGLEARDAADRAEAENLVRDGEVDAALVAENDNWQVISDGLPDTSVMTTVDALAESYSQAAALEQLGISTTDFQAASPEINVEAVDIANIDEGKDDASSEQDFARLLTAFILLMLIVFMVITFAAQVGSRVTEEKSSRVVELVLAAVRPLDFLAGKIWATSSSDSSPPRSCSAPVSPHCSSRGYWRTSASTGPSSPSCSCPTCWPCSSSPASTPPLARWSSAPRTSNPHRCPSCY